MSLINLAYAKTNFPKYDKFFLDSDGEYSDTVLQNEIDLAEAEYTNYKSVAADTITDAEKLEILIILKKRGFNRLHEDEQFEIKPQIIKEYEALIKSLSEIKKTSGSVSITAKTRRFDTWFNEEY